MSLRELIEGNLRAVSAKDLDAAIADFADDAVVDDPHHPMRPARGRDAIAEVLVWTFQQMKSMHFEIDNYFESADGRGAAVEASCRFEPGMGSAIELRQVFVVESDGTKITRWTAYEPYRPNGVMGAGLRVGHTVYHLGKRIDQLRGRSGR